MCGVNRFGPILSAVPPEYVSAFAEQRDLAITCALTAVQGFPVDTATTTRDFPMVAGGAGLLSHQRTSSASYIGAFFRVARPLVHRLVQMGGMTTSMAIALLEDPLASRELGQDWAISVTSTHAEAIALHASFTPQKLLTMSIVAPRGNIITSTGDTSSVATDLH